MCAGASTALALNLSGKSDLKATEPEIYTLTLDATNVTPGASFTVNTAEGNPVVFEADGLDVVGGQLVLAQDGYIRNAVDHEIRGMAQIIPTFQGKIVYDYTWGDSLKAANPYYQRRNYRMPDRESLAEHVYSFLDEAPNYVQIKALEETKFDSIEIKYSCEKTPEAGDNLVLGSAVMFERFKTVSAWGTTFAGQTVELSDDFSMNGISMTPISTFEGVFDGKGHTISDLTLSGADQTAPFRNVVGGTVKNVNFTNLDVTGTSQRASGAVGRAENATIENVTVSGSITGTTEMGGIAGVALRKTTIKNCVNNATITASGSTTGGIVGNLYCGTGVESHINIEGCVNNGAIHSSQTGNAFVGGIAGASVASSTLSFFRILDCTNKGVVSGLGNYIGGVFGLPRAAIVGSVIANCHNEGTVSGNTYIGGVIGAARVNTIGCSCMPNTQVKGVAASTLNKIGGAAADAGFITGTQEALGTSLPKALISGALLTTAISSVAELEAYRNAVNAGTATGGAYLTADLDLSSIENFVPIGNDEAFQFNFVFDGMGHTISNLTIDGSNHLGLFGYATGADGDGVGIRNLNLSNVDIKSTAGYSSALVGRLISGAVSGITVTGTIASEAMTPNGGVVAILDTTDNIVVISNCKNYATLTAGSGAGSGGNAGILGYSMITKTTIYDCENHGDVNARGTGTGGIIGSSAAANTSGSAVYCIVEKCSNYGSISGTAYVGGVAGLLREQSNTLSGAKDCKNYGDAYCNGTTSAGGVAALARINVDNCGSLNTISVSVKTTAASAACGQIITGTGGGSKPGFVLGGLGNNKTMSNCYSFDANGNVVEVYPDVTAPAAS